MRLLTGILLTAVVLAIEPQDISAQSVLCQAIRPGETAASVARRLTGNANNRIQPWFTIVDRNRRVVSKVDYDDVLAGWHACLPAARLKRTAPVVARSPLSLATSPVTVAPLPVAVPLTVAVAPRVTQSRATPAVFASRDSMRDLALIGLGAILIGVAIGLAWQGVEQGLIRREAVAREMRRFGEGFVKDFERPLRIEGVTSPIRARLRCAPGKQRLEILVAPAAGRRYPNLDDHRQNVEYDVARITQRLSRQTFVRRPLHAEGPWVVIPFRFEPGPRTGAVV